jgi:DsbC/DsbD-like thiol-disulfide interchange protein
MRQGVGSREKGIGVLLLALVVAPVMVAQAISFGFGGAAKAKKEHVVLLSDGVMVDAGKAEIVELRFRVDAGYHINSHTPKDPLLIPTRLTLDAGPGVTVLGEVYPKGEAFKLGQGSDSMLLDVYQGEFRVMVRVRAAKGPQTLVGSLHYQACDDASCFPPKTLPVKIAVTAE